MKVHVLFPWTLSPLDLTLPGCRQRSAWDFLRWCRSCPCWLYSLSTAWHTGCWLTPLPCRWPFSRSTGLHRNKIWNRLTLNSIVLLPKSELVHGQCLIWLSSPCLCIRRDPISSSSVVRDLVFKADSVANRTKPKFGLKLSCKAHLLFPFLGCFAWSPLWLFWQLLLFLF